MVSMWYLERYTTPENLPVFDNIRDSKSGGSLLKIGDPLTTTGIHE